MHRFVMGMCNVHDSFAIENLRAGQITGRLQMNQGVLYHQNNMCEYTVVSIIF